MAKKQVRKFKVKRGIQRDGVWRFEPGDTVDEAKLKSAPVEHWLDNGVLEVDDGNG